MVNKIHPTVIIRTPIKLGDNIEIQEFSTISATPMIFENFKILNASFGVEIGNGVYIGPHSTIMSGYKAPTLIGNDVALGQYTNIGHDCIIHDRVEIIGSVFLSGFVEVGEGTKIHAGSIIRNRIKIGKNCIIGQDSNVVEDIPDETMAYGNPCKPQKTLNNGKPDMIYRIKKKAQRMLR